MNISRRVRLTKRKRDKVGGFLSEVAVKPTKRGRNGDYPVRVSIDARYVFAPAGPKLAANEMMKGIGLIDTGQSHAGAPRFSY